MEVVNLARVLERKEEELRVQYSTEYPINPNLIEPHKRKCLNAKKYLDEVKDVMMWAHYYTTVFKVTKQELNAQIKHADDVSFEYEGEFCKLVAIHNFGRRDKYLLYCAPNRVL